MAKEPLPLIGYRNNIVFTPRFLAKVKRGPEPDDCWTWVGGTMRNVNGGRTPCFRMDNCLSAVRASYALFNGDLGAGVTVTRCAVNALCVSPRHLRLQCDEVRPRARARALALRVQPVAAGKRNAKLAARDIPEIRRLLARGISWHVIGPMYGVSGTAVYQVAKGISWRHA